MQQQQKKKKNKKNEKNFFFFLSTIKIKKNVYELKWMKNKNNF